VATAATRAGRGKQSQNEGGCTVGKQSQSEGGCAVGNEGHPNRLGRHELLGWGGNVHDKVVNAVGFGSGLGSTEHGAGVVDAGDSAAGEGSRTDAAAALRNERGDRGGQSGGGGVAGGAGAGLRVSTHSRSVRLILIDGAKVTSEGVTSEGVTSGGSGGEGCGGEGESASSPGGFSMSILRRAVVEPFRDEDDAADVAAAAAAAEQLSLAAQKSKRRARAAQQDLSAP